MGVSCVKRSPRSGTPSKCGCVCQVRSEVVLTSELVWGCSLFTPNLQSKTLEFGVLDPSTCLLLRGDIPLETGRSPDFSTRDADWCGFLLRGSAGIPTDLDGPRLRIGRSWAKRSRRGSPACSGDPLIYTIALKPTSEVSQAPDIRALEVFLFMG